MDERDLPPLPIPPPREGPVAESSRRHSHRSKASVRDLAALILIEQREHRDTQRELARVTELLRLATQRADENERRVSEVTERLKSVNEARIAAVREAARANESLGLYKFQLETAQNEIHRAQSVFNIVEKERYEAELAGAKSRTAARKLNEQHKIHLAREQGRRLGLKEGFEAGRHVFADEHADAPALSTFGDSQPYEYNYEDVGDEVLGSSGSSVATDDLYSPLPPRNPATPFRDTPAPLPVPPPAPREAVPTTGRLSPLFEPFHDIHPTPVHNEAPHPRHEHIDVPPDGYIPVTGPDEIPHIPPPHEFLFQRETSPPHNNGSSVVEEPAIVPSAFARAMSPRHRAQAQSIRAESVRYAPSAAGSVRPVQMPTPRMNTNLPGIERQAQRSSWSSDFFGGGPPVQPPQPSETSSGPIPINIQPPSRPISHTSSAQVGTPSMGSKLFGPDVAVPRDSTRPLSRPSIYMPGSDAPPGTAAGAMSPGFVPLGFHSHPNPSGTSPMPGAYAAPSEDPIDSDVSYHPVGPNGIDSPSTHSSDFTLSTPPETRRYHPHKPPRPQRS
ncbi:hypothetical protein B0H19DRAFT_27576 [Mycena capillaripes]|nr:hypothetical protein B0H19DRAFT_27576 [Mycena capillaripes]